MRRRDLLKAAAAAMFTAGVAPRLGRGADRACDFLQKSVSLLGTGDVVESASGRVSRTRCQSTTVRNCTRDEGGPFETGSQV